MSTVRSIFNTRFAEKMLTPRHYEWQVASAFTQYVASCHHERRLPVREFRLPNVLWQ